VANAWLNKFRDLSISSKFESNQKENLQINAISNNSHENSSIFDSIKLEIYLSHQNLSQIKKKICKLKQFSNNSRKNL
jgi:hypothetical protein